VRLDLTKHNRNTKLCSNPNDPTLLVEKHNLANLLAEYYNNVHEAAKLKAGVKHAVDGERATSFFSALVKNRAAMP
jgi:hypothetical protein